MLAILGAIIGLFGSAVPEVLKLWKIKLDHQHEIEVLRIQAEMAKTEHHYKLEEIEAQADVASEQAVYKAAEVKYTDVKWIDGTLEFVNGIIRPWLTIMFTLFYGIVKYAQYELIRQSGAFWADTVWKLWNTEDMAVYATIISFWFGGRMMKWAMNKWAPTPTRQMGNGGVINNNHPKTTLVPVKPDKPVDKPVDPKPAPDLGGR